MACIDRPGEIFAVRLARGEGAVDRGRVLEAFLLDVQVAEPRIDDGRVGRVVVRDEELVDRRDRVLVVRERDRHDAQRVVGQLAVGARQLLERDQLVRRLACSMVRSSTPANDGRLSSLRPCLNSDQPCL